MILHLLTSQVINERSESNRSKLCSAGFVNVAQMHCRLLQKYSKNPFQSELSVFNISFDMAANGYNYLAAVMCCFLMHEFLA